MKAKTSIYNQTLAAISLNTNQLSTADQFQLHPPCPIWWLLFLRQTQPRNGSLSFLISATSSLSTLCHLRHPSSDALPLERVDAIRVSSLRVPLLLRSSKRQVFSVLAPIYLSCFHSFKYLLITGEWAGRRRRWPPGIRKSWGNQRERCSTSFG